MQRYSLFLTPSEPDSAFLEALIRELCGKHGGNPFEPHVTLYSGDLRDLEALKRVVSASMLGVRPFALDVRGVDCREEYFRSLFIDFEENPVLPEINARIRGGFGIDAGYELTPHLSLLYSDMPLSAKKALAENLVLGVPRIHFDRVKIVSPGNREEGWRDTTQWRTLFHVGLEDDLGDVNG